MEVEREEEAEEEAVPIVCSSFRLKSMGFCTNEVEGEEEEEAEEEEEEAIATTDRSLDLPVL